MVERKIEKVGVPLTVYAPTTKLAMHFSVLFCQVRCPLIIMNHCAKWMAFYHMTPRMQHKTVARLYSLVFLIGYWNIV